MCPTCRVVLKRERLKPGEQEGGSYSSVLASDWPCEDRDGGHMLGKASTAIRDGLGGQLEHPALCSFHMVARAGE